MNPGLLIKLRPAGPWRIGPDSGARNRVDYIYHSDTLYSAVTLAMERLGDLDAWLDATARGAPEAPPAVCFSSCFPFLNEIGFIVPPRTIWPPTSPALMSAHVRWKSARFVPLEVVRLILAGKTPDENQWSVDGPSECLVPAGSPGPFRTALRGNAAVDRVTGCVTERHSTACLEFRPGSGLWTVAAFHDEAAQARWLDPVKTAFRLLADTGFGGERSRGWGRTGQPEFIEGSLPELILGQEDRGQGPGGVPTDFVGRGQGAGSAEVRAPEALLPFEAVAPPVEEPNPEPPVSDPPSEPQATEAEPLDAGPETEPDPTPVTEPDPEVPPAEEPQPEPPVADPPFEPEFPEPEPPEPDPHETGSAPEPKALVEQTSAEAAAPGPQPPAPGPRPHWLLSLFTPAPGDSIDWRRGNYGVLARGGRVDSPAGSGGLKKQLHMLAEGSVVYAASLPSGVASDVAPDGFAHPVFRAGFAVSIPLPEVS